MVAARKMVGSENPPYALDMHRVQLDVGKFQEYYCFVTMGSDIFLKLNLIASVQPIASVRAA